MLKARMAHCAEGAVFAAAALAYHGRPPLLMDIRALPADQDHIVTLFRERGVKLDRFLPSYTDYLRWIALICKDRKVPLVLMTQPTLWKEKHSKEEEAARARRRQERRTFSSSDSP